jgi:hypothetical protein
MRILTGRRALRCPPVDSTGDGGMGDGGSADPGTAGVPASGDEGGGRHRPARERWAADTPGLLTVGPRSPAAWAGVTVLRVHH